MELVRTTLGPIKTWRPWHPTGGRASEPGAALFRGLRIRLTLWYSGVLAVALLASGVVLYFGVQDLTLSPVNAFLRSLADINVHEWQETPPHPCGETGAPPPEGRGEPNRRPEPQIRRTTSLPFYVACIDLQGHVIGGAPGATGPSGATPAGFLNTSLLGAALREGAANDVVDGGAMDGGEDVGPIYRLAVAALDPTSGKPLGIVQVGQSIEPQWDTLRLLRELLLLISVLVMIGSVAVGLILAERALVPARLAFARQQAFVADASHQLRTPLTLLRADAEVLLRHRDRLPPDDAELLEDIVAETAHMDQLATSLLALARLDAGPQHLEYEIIDLADLAAEVGRRVGTLAHEKGLTVGEDYVARPRLMGDRQALEQAALILVENAIRYTPPGGSITLRTAATDGQASLIVQDTGVGIPPEHLQHLGERFYRVDAARSRAAGGAGLGLAIAHKIAAAHGGALQLSSDPGEGTRATLTLSMAGPHRS